MKSSRSRIVAASLAVVAILAVSAPSTVHAQESGFSAKRALIGAAIGGGVGFLIMAMERGRDKDFRIEPKQLEFPRTRSGQQADQTFVVRNTGTRRIQIESVAVKSQGGAFSLVNAAPMPVSLQPGAEAAVAIRFVPGAARGFSDAVEIRIARGAKQPARVSVSVRGTGTS
jgi:urease beta subunit